MKRLLKTTPDPSRARIQHQAFVDLLNSTTDLKEREHVLPFFGNSLDLAFLFSHYIPAIINADRIATEFQIYGDFKADLIVGDSSQGKYLLVEFENGSANSVFKSNKKAIPDWGARFEAAFSQLVDWLWKLDDMRHTDAFENLFERRDAEFTGLIVIGKGMTLAPQEVKRLRWRQDKIRINSLGYSIISFEDFRDAADAWLRNFYRV